MSAKGREKAILASKELQNSQAKINVENPQGGSPDQGTMNQTKNLLTKRNKKPAYMQSLNEAEKAENFKIIDNMSKKITFLKNPRFKVTKAPIMMTDAGSGQITDPKNPFRVEPHLVQFVDYQVNGLYEIPVKITNASSICRRIKFIPPSTENFTLKNVKYPSKIVGDIAPGMSVTLTISFCAPSFADFDDNLTVVTEENSFKIPLRARRDPPVISLVNPLDCLHSWLGDKVDMVFRCVNTGGDGGFKFFCEKDEDDIRQTDPDTLRIGSFALNPSEFYLYSGNAIDVYVSFNPDREGQLEENLILACDNQTSEFYKMAGYGAMLDLDIISVDGRAVDFKANPFQTLFFENTNPTSTSKRTITIRNTSPILVPFHWSVYKSKSTNKIILGEEETHYRIEPNQGKIQGGQSIEFTIYFSPDHAEPYYEFADLIVEDIPIQAVRNPPEGLRQFAAANAPRSKVPMPTYIGSNTQFLSIPLISFNMRGQGNSCQVQIEPPVTFFEGDMFINNTYTQKVKLIKDYEGTVKYSLRMEGKSKQSFNVDLIAQGRSLMQNGNLLEGELKIEKAIDLELQISSSECGEQMAYFFIEVQDGTPMSFSCKANFIGPIIRVIEPVLDFGLAKVNMNQKHRVKIENLSPIQSQIIIKNSKNKRLNFQTLNQYEKSDEIDGDPSVGVSKTTNGNTIKINTPSLTIPANSSTEIVLTLDTLKSENVEEYFEIMVKDSDSQFFQVLADVQKPRVMLSRNIIDLGRIYAGITEVIDYDNKQSLTLKNYGNLPAMFQWEEKIDQDKIIARFEPSRGMIPPKSEIQISFSATVYVGGNINELFICDIDDLEIPLGFELHADAFGLNVVYESTDETAAPMALTQTTFKPHQSQTSAFVDMDVPFSMKSGSQAGDRNQGAIAKLQREFEGKHLKMLTFANCKINKNSTQKFILKNLSGIKTSFKFSSMIFEPLSHQAPQQKSEIQKAQEAQVANSQQITDENLNTSPSKHGTPMKPSGGKQIRFAPSAKSGSRFGTSLMKGQEPVKKWNRAILSDEHEQTQKFSSATGETFTQTKKLDKEQSFFLSNNKGIAIVFNPQIGDLPPHSEVPITVTIYNNVCGKFDDKIVSEIKGLGPVEFPINIQITGSPIVIPLNQVGLNYKTTPPTLPIPTVVTNSQPVTKTFNIKNTGIRSIQVDWKIFDSKDLIQKDKDYFNLSVAKNFSYDRRDNPFKFNFEALEPEESLDSAFEISPKNLQVGPRQVCTFNVTFYSNKGEGEFKSVIIASPELSRDELQIAEDGDELTRKGALGIISLNLYAMTIKPKLTIDKKSRNDGVNHLNFKYWSVSTDADAPSDTQMITYTNDSKADLNFNLSVTGPFEIVKTKSNTGAKHPLATAQPPSKVVKQKAETLFCLQPLKILEISIKFLSPSPFSNEEWPVTIKNERHGEVTAFFSNGDIQKLMLDAFMLRPKLQLLTEKRSKNDKAMDELDFGVVNVDKSRTIKVFLSNMTEPTARWKLNYVSFPKKSTIGYSTTTPWEVENMEKNDDPDVFEFSMTEGFLKGKSLPLRKAPEGLSVPPVPKDDFEKQYLPQTVLINFRPKLNVLYKSKFRFTVENGISCDVILKGKGSYEENHD